MHLVRPRSRAFRAISIAAARSERFGERSSRASRCRNLDPYRTRPILKVGELNTYAYFAMLFTNTNFTSTVTRVGKRRGLTLVSRSFHAGTSVCLLRRAWRAGIEFPREPDFPLDSIYIRRSTNNAIRDDETQTRLISPAVSGDYNQDGSARDICLLAAVAFPLVGRLQHSFATCLDRSNGPPVDYFESFRVIGQLRSSAISPSMKSYIYSVGLETSCTLSPTAIFACCSIFPCFQIPLPSPMLFLV